MFAKTESNGEAIVGLFNTGENAETVSIQASAVALLESERGYSTRDLWTGERKKRRGATSVRLSHRTGSFYTASKHLDYLLATLTVHSASCRRIENLPMWTTRGPMVGWYLVLGDGMRLVIIAFVLGR